MEKIGFSTIDFGRLGNGNSIGIMAVLYFMIDHAVAIDGVILKVSIEFVAVKLGNERLGERIVEEASRTLGK